MRDMINQELLPKTGEAKHDSKWKRYKHYRSWGAYTLEEAPNHWEVRRLGLTSQMNPSKSEIQRLNKATKVSFLPMELIGEDGSLILSETREIEQVSSGYTYFRNGDIIIAKITPCFENGKGALCKDLVNSIGFGTTELHVLRPQVELLPSFLFYITRSPIFKALGTASMTGSAGQQRVTSDFIKNFLIALPPLNEQQAIVTFLGRETTKINALISKRERMINLLQERRAAVINQAVTKGLNPGVKMKDSGVEWLGEIPEHWNIRRIKYLSSFLTSGSRGWAQYYADNGAIFLRIGNLTRSSISLKLDDIQYVQPPQGTEGQRTKVKENDVLISITAYIGSIAVITENIGEAYVSQHIALVRPKPDTIDSKWIGYNLVSKTGQDQFRLLENGGTKDGLGLDDVNNLLVQLPPIQEQKQIVSYLEQETAKIDKLISGIEQSIEKLKEYKIALISAAVTGQIDVQREFDAIDAQSAENVIE